MVIVGSVEQVNSIAKSNKEWANSFILQNIERIQSFYGKEVVLSTKNQDLFQATDLIMWNKGRRIDIAVRGRNIDKGYLRDHPIVRDATFRCPGPCETSNEYDELSKIINGYADRYYVFFANDTPGSTILDDFMLDLEPVREDGILKRLYLIKNNHDGTYFKPCAYEKFESIPDAVIFKNWKSPARVEFEAEKMRKVQKRTKRLLGYADLESNII
jgi:hypothetical protein